MFKFINKLLDLNQREVDRLSKIAAQINLFEDKAKKLKDSDFSKKTSEFKKRLAKGETLNDLLPEAFAVVREASWRTLVLRHYDEQLMAAAALFEGKVVEQKTGEGKTLSAVPALYLHAITGKGAHLVTVNDYLARRDAGWNAPIFALLGLTTSSIAQEMKSYLYDTEYEDKSHGDERLAHLKPVSRRQAYEADITYGTNNEFGFDYLRDNMVLDLSQCVQRELNYAIVDEVDNILIDEARTPLIISGAAEDATQKYYTFAKLIPRLRQGEDYVLEERTRAVTLTEVGLGKMEQWLHVPNLYAPPNYALTHYIDNALKAYVLFKKDRDYVVKDGEVIIVDEFTGRLMHGRRYSEGLHQAIEAKENVKIQRESVTLATITFQNYFRMYEKLSGMTGTAKTSAE